MKKFLIAAIFVVIFVDYSMCNPMLYKRNDNDKYEPDLIPVSSTVIPLSVYEVSYGLGGKPSEEYKMAYFKKLRKKVKHEDEDEDPDTLITIKKKNSDTSKAKVKGI